MAMYSSYRTEINPTERQKRMLDKNFEACRKIYNLYLCRALEQYDKNNKFENVDEFIGWFYKTYMKSQYLSRSFPRGYSSIAIRRTCKNVYGIMNRYSYGKTGRPRRKNEEYGRITIYFANIKSRHEFILSDRHRIYVPGFGWILLKEKGYIPCDKRNMPIVSGYISEHLGRYYISVNVDNKGLSLEGNRLSYGESTGKICYKSSQKLYGEPLGIDMGLNWFAVLSDGRAFRNINKQRNVILLEKRVNRLQRSLSRKYNNQKKEMIDKKSAGYNKTKFELEKTYQKLHNIRSNYLNFVICKIVKTHPKYVAIEDLDVSEMMKTRAFSRSISRQMFYEFRERLIKKCAKEGIEVRIVNRWFPSSKRCHNCGRVKKRLLISEREYVCECGYSINRDLNASLNLRDSNEYITA